MRVLQVMAVAHRPRAEDDEAKVNAVPYLDVTDAAGRHFMMRGIAGPVVMLNLLRFRKIADYRATPELAPDAPISGAAAYDCYIVETMPHLLASGGAVLFYGSADRFLIGPEGEVWDRAMLVRQSSVAAFMEHAQTPGILAALGHRTAALADSRLLPLQEMALPG